MAETGLPPWHMWGSSEIVHAVGVNTQLYSIKQLARINYARPETWRFFFWAQLVNSNQDDGNCVIVYDLTIGVGRTSKTIPKFGRFSFTWAGGFVPTLNADFLKWAVEFPGPLRVDGDATTGTLVELFTAQDIQVTTRVQLITESTSAFVDVEVGTFFAPEVHIRPEWNAHPNNIKVTQFPGNEANGH